MTIDLSGGALTFNPQLPFKSPIILTEKEYEKIMALMLPKAIICDIDGTVALKGERGPYDWDRVGEDEPNHPVIDLVRKYDDEGLEIVFLSGRMQQCRSATETWLCKHVHRDCDFELYMRADEDFRPDTVVKEELYRKHVESFHRVHVVLDDRNSMVAMWRGLGLTCFQVADGDF